MKLNNVKVTEPIYQIYVNEKIAINSEAIVEFLERKCISTPEMVLSFCRVFKNANKNKGKRGEYYENASEHTLELQEVFEVEAPKSHEYALLAHILLAQSGISSKVVSAAGEEDDENGHAFVVYSENGKVKILDAALQEKIVEPDADGIYRHKSEKRNQVVVYNMNVKNCVLVTPAKASEDVPNYAPKG